MTLREKQYAERNCIQLDSDGGYYMRHVQALTREDLRSKADIAAELGWRDREIDRLKHDIESAIEENTRLVNAGSDWIRVDNPPSLVDSVTGIRVLAWSKPLNIMRQCSYFDEVFVGWDYGYPPTHWMYEPKPPEESDNG